MTEAVAPIEQKKRKVVLAFPALFAAPRLDELKAAGFEAELAEAKLGNFTVDVVIVRAVVDVDRWIYDQDHGLHKLTSIVFRDSGVKEIGEPFLEVEADAPSCPPRAPRTIDLTLEEKDRLLTQGVQQLEVSPSLGSGQGRTAPDFDNPELRVIWQKNLVTLITMKAPDVIFHLPSKPLLLPTLVKKRFGQVIGDLSRVTGKRFVVHLGSAHVRDPRPPEPNTINVLFGCAPTGESYTQYLATIFGRKIAEDGKKVQAMAATPGRGTTLLEGETAIAQLVGSDLYIMAPLPLYYHGRESEAIFEEIMVQAWNVMVRKPPSQEKAAADATSFAATVIDWLEEIPRLYLTSLQQISRDIADYQAKLADLYRQQRETMIASEGFRKHGFITGVVEKLPGEFVRVADHPRVAKVAVVSGGIQVWTKPLSIYYGVLCYDVGAFVIRLNNLGRVTVWSEAPTHPAGVPHPHIGLDGVPCFGNAGEALAEAAGNFRVAEVFAIVITWLEHGYCDDLATIKIWGWPLCRQKVAEPQERNDASTQNA